MKDMALGLNAASPPSAALHLRFCGFPPSNLMVINGSSIPIYSSTERYAPFFPHGIARQWKYFFQFLASYRHLVTY